MTAAEICWLYGHSWLSVWIMSPRVYLKHTCVVCETVEASLP